MNKRIMALAGGLVGVLAGRVVLSRLNLSGRLAQNALVSSEPEVEHALATAINDFRSRHFTAELIDDDALTAVAQQQAEYLSRKGEVGHTDAAGASVLERVQAASDDEFTESIEFIARLRPADILSLRERGRVGSAVLAQGLLTKWTTDEHEDKLLDESMDALGTGIVFDSSGCIYAVVVTAC